MSDLVAIGWSLQQCRGPCSRLVVLILAFGVQWASASRTDAKMTITADRVWISKGDNFDVKCESSPLKLGGFVSLMHAPPGQEKREELARLTSFDKVHPFFPWVSASGGKGENSVHLQVTVRMEAGREGRYFCVFKAAPGLDRIFLEGATVSLYDPQPDHDVTDPASAARAIDALTANDRTGVASPSVSTNVTPSPLPQGTDTKMTITADRVWIGKGGNFDVKCESSPLKLGGFVSLMHARPGQEKREELARLTSFDKVRPFFPWVSASGGKGENSVHLQVTVRMEAGREGCYFCVFKAAPGLDRIFLEGATVSLYDPQPDHDVTDPASAARAIDALTANGRTGVASPSVSTNVTPSPLPQGWDPKTGLVIGLIVLLACIVIVIVVIKRLRHRRQDHPLSQV